VKLSFVLAGAVLLATTQAGSVARALPDYYDISDTATAQAEARQLKLPLAYLGSFPECLTDAAPNPGGQSDLTQMALATLQGNAVVIFFDGRNMAPVPAIIHAQYHIQDDGPLPGGAAWNSPKVVFSNPDITKILGRVSHTQMLAGRAAPLYTALQAIRDDPSALAPLPPPPAPVAAADTSTTTGQPASDDSPANYFARLTGMTNQSLYTVGGSILAVAVLFSLIGRLRR